MKLCTSSTCRSLTTLLLLIKFTSSWASHVVGGNLEMIALDKTPGRFRIALNMYFDEINQNVGGVPESDALLFVYRKSDNKRVTSFYVSYVSRKPITYTNQTCATLRQIKTTLYRYEQVVNWKASDYNDPGGYYITWQYCCRNGDIDNIRQPNQAGQTFYLEFPGIIPGRLLLNSSPIFDQVDGEFMCVGEPFRFSFDAKDDDGDELLYSLATPFDRLDPELGIGSKNGLTIQWLPGFGPNNAIPGNPTLSINNKTGEMTVTASQQGLYVFTVIVEEYRNGKQIGLVRRDYQLFAVDCPPTIPPDPTITLDNRPLSEFQFCEGKTAELKSTYNANWEYQWKKDGKSIPGATQSSFLVKESGTYQLITSLKAQCSKLRRSSEVKITVTKSRFTLKKQGSLRICGASGLVKLDAITGSNFSYQWYLDEKPLSDNVHSLNVRQAGRYRVVVKDNLLGCTSQSDTVVVYAATLPEAVISSKQANSTICSGDSLLLSSSYKMHYTYQWALNGSVLPAGTTNELIARTNGQYTLIVTDTSGCQAISLPFVLSVVPGIIVTMDSLPHQCGIASSSIIPLKGNPVGGVFSGPGVSGNMFDPKIAGAGQHRITYTYKGTLGLACQEGIAQRIAVVADPTVKLVPSMAVNEICNNDSLVLSIQPSINTIILQQRWTLNGNPIKGGEKLVVRQTGQYKVSIIDLEGCIAESLPFSLTVSPKIQVTMDLIPPVCGTKHGPITLKGYPAGGIFGGPGVTDNQYSPEVAGLGTHRIVYTVSSPLICQNGTAMQFASVKPIPTVSLGPDIDIRRESTVQLKGDLGSQYSYYWTPVIGLSNPNTADPIATVGQTVNYTLTVTDSSGCTASDDILLRVYEPIWIPDAFSPNGDGVNDYWELRGINYYPQAEITIYNRWGEIVFRSQGYEHPFNGYYHASPLSPGVYTYRIKPSSSQNALQGSVMLVR